MPSIHHLNPPPNPFWDFVAGLEDHPFFAAYGPPQPPRQSHGPQGAQGPPAPPAPEAADPDVEMSEKAQGKQASVEDPPEVDPTTVGRDGPIGNSEDDQRRGFPFRGRGRFANAFANDNEGEPRGDGPEGPCRRGGRGPCGRGGWGQGPARFHRGPPPWMFGAPWLGPEGPPGPPGPHHHGPPHHGPGPEGMHQHPLHHGPGPEGPHHHPHHPHHRGGRSPHGGPRGGPHGHGPHPPPPHGPRRHSPPHHRGDHPRGPGGQSFNLGSFLNNLGERLGIDVSNAAEGLGLDRFSAPRTSGEIDFEPRADIFENSSNYIIHLSLPGAKKSDVGVDYDGDHSVLRITGVVHRPSVDEEMMATLVVDGRKRETGVFEKAILLGTKRDPAPVDVANITAKMTDGVLVVNVPKLAPKPAERRDVPISSASSATASPAPEPREKDTLFDADHEMSDSHNAPALDEKHDTIPLAEMTELESHKEKDPIAHAEKSTEPLPVYQAEDMHSESDWEKYSDDGEGEFVKINVD